MLIREATILYFVIGVIVIFTIERKGRTRQKGTLHEAMDYINRKSSPVAYLLGSTLANIVAVIAWPLIVINYLSKN